jgi:hypothetical protein
LSSVAYIVPSDLLSTAPPAAEWHATGIPPDFAQSLVIVKWDNPNDEREFESQLGVVRFPDPWEPMPADVALLLASFQDPLTTTQSVAIPLTDVPVAPESVASALRKVSWPGIRMMR